MTRIVTDATDFWNAKVAKRAPRPPSNGSKCGAFPRFSPNLCQSVKSVDVFLRNLRYLWFLLTEAEQLRFPDFGASRVRQNWRDHSFNQRSMTTLVWV